MKFKGSPQSSIQQSASNETYIWQPAISYDRMMQTVVSKPA